MKFCFHVEDMFLNSVFYIHANSAVKLWYIIPSHQAELVKQYAGAKVFELKRFAKDSQGTLLAAKAIMMDPFDMAKYGISVIRAFETSGSFLVTAPQGYHGGFKSGSNVMEAVNLGNPEWFAIGNAAAELYAKEGRAFAVPFEFVVFIEALNFERRRTKSAKKR